MRVPICLVAAGWMACAPIDPVEDAVPTVAEEPVETVDCDAAPSGVAVGQCALDLEMPDAGLVDRWISDYRGDVVLLSNHAMWCDTCEFALILLGETQDELADRGFRVVDIVIEDVDGDTPIAEHAGDWTDEYALDFTVLADIDGRYKANYIEDAANLFMFYVLDRNGEIAFVGPAEDEPSWERAHEAILAELDTP